MEDFTRDVKLEIHYRKGIVSVYDATSDEEILRVENVKDLSWGFLHNHIMNPRRWNAK